MRVELVAKTFFFIGKHVEYVRHITDGEKSWSGFSRKWIKIHNGMLKGQV